MAKYIEREEAVRMAVESATEIFDCHTTLPLLKVANKIRAIPSVDVVEVVRCKDCQSYSDFDTTKCKRLEFHFCDKFGIITKESDFCSFGVRKEGAEE